MLYKSDYVEFDLELSEDRYYIHVEILKKDKETRDQVRKTWLGLQEYLLAKGITEVYATIPDDDFTLKEFARSYGFNMQYEISKGEDIFEIWVAEI